MKKRLIITLCLAALCTAMVFTIPIIADKLTQPASQESKIYSEIKKRDGEQAPMVLGEYYAVISEYSIPAKEQAVLEALILNGADAERVMQIYRFVYNTWYDVSLVEPMYEMGVLMGFEREFWLYDAFDSCTNYIHGNLTVQEVRELRDKGFEYDEIIAADSLSKMGKKDIKKLLEEKENGKEWAAICEEVYLGCAKTKDIASGIGSFKDKGVGEIISAVNLCLKTNEEAKEYLAAEDTQELILEKESEIFDKASAAALEKVSAIGGQEQ